MGRLIEEMDAILALQNAIIELGYDPLGKRQNKIYEAIEKVPTAYDADAVIADLKERTEFLKDCTKYGNESAEQQEKSHSPMMMYEVADLMDDLIDIVERGGINE